MTRASTGSAGSAGVLTVAVVPAGDAADASARLRPALTSARLIAAADPGWLRELAARLGVTLVGQVVPYAGDAGTHRVARPAAANVPPAAELPPAPGAPAEAELPPAPGAPAEAELPSAPDARAAAAAQPASGLLAELLAGRDVLLVTDAGVADGRDTAGVAGGRDPVGQFVAAAAAAGIRVTVLPGASRVTTALAVSGLPGDRFVVEGFPPRGSSDRERRLAELAAERRTLLFVDARDRIGATLAALAAAFGADRKAAVCPDPGTPHADVLRGTLGELASQLAGGGPAGDVTLVVAGAGAPVSAVALPDAVKLVRARVLAGATTKDAVAAVAAATGLRRRDLYNAAARDATAGSAGRSS